MKRTIIAVLAVTALAWAPISAHALRCGPFGACICIPCQIK